MSGPGSARRWSTGWWTRCSAGSTLAGRRTCRSRRPCPALAEESRRRASLAEAAGALMPPPAAAPAPPAAPPRPPSSPRSPAAWEPCRRRSPPRRGPEVRTGAMVRELARTPGGWRLTVGSATRPEQPGRRRRRAGRARRPRPGCSPGCREPPTRGAALAGIALREHGDRHPGLPGRRRFPRPLEGSGYLVPAVDGHPVKAVTFSSVKWPHLRSADPEHGGGPLLAGPGRGGAAAAAGRRRPGQRWPRPTWPRRPASAASRPASG